MHVDGFRFDLAATLARELHDVDRSPPSSTSSSRTRSSARSSSSPSRGTSARAATRWATSRRCGRSGTASTATRSATSGGAAEHSVAEFGYRFTGSSDLYQPNGRTPYASVNFVTAHDGFTLTDLVSYDEQAQRGQRRGQPRRHRRQPVVELRGRGPHRRPRGARPAPPPTAQPADHPAALPGRPHAPRRRRARSHATGQQQRLLPGRPRLLVRLGPRRPGAARVHPPPHGVPPRPPGLPASAVLPGPSDRRRGHRRHRLVHLRGRHHDRGRLALRRQPGHRSVPQRRRPAQRRAPGRAHQRRQLLRHLQRLRRGPRVPPARPQLGPRVGPGDRHLPGRPRRRASPTAATAASPLAPPSPSAPGRSSCCAGCPRTPPGRDRRR